MVTVKTSWGYLPLEIRRMILKSLLQDESCLAPYATVCREWQEVVEEKNFSRLNLTSSRLADFGKMVDRQRDLVRYIWLCIELQEYDCFYCENGETDQWHETNTAIVGKAIRELLIILSAWEPSGSLLLDISAYSPSDSKHHFKYLHHGPDVIPKRKQETENAHDPRHGWLNGSRVFLPPHGPINRLFEDIEMTLDFWQGLPEVTAVTGLLLRRQTRHRWEPGTIRELCKLLPRLREIFYEPWREWNQLDQRWTDESNYRLFKSLIPNQLKKMVLFEDFNDDYVTLFQGSYETVNAEPIRTANFAVSRAVAEASLGLERLSASFIIDARSFFKVKPTWIWNNLVSLALTSRLLVPDKSRGDINDMLQAAAAAAMKMPRLNAMELWNGGKGLACVFRYQAPKDRRYATLTWRGNWYLRLEFRVIRSWEAVALKRIECELQIVTEMIDSDDIKSHGDAIHTLKLLHQVVRPASLWQIRKETGHYQ